MSEPIQIDYYTDAYCAWSWAIEPTLADVRLQEGAAVRWRVFEKVLIADLATSGKSGEDIAKAWEKVERLTAVPLDATRWRTDPPTGTTAAARGAKAAARFGGAEAELRFLSALRPMLMKQGRSADDRETLVAAAAAAKIDVEAFTRALDDPTLDTAIAEDARHADEAGIRSTPALVLTNAEGDRIVIEGPRDLQLLQRAIQVLRTDAAVAEAAAARKA